MPGKKIGVAGVLSKIIRPFFPIFMYANELHLSLKLSCRYRNSGDIRYSTTRLCPVLISTVTAMPGARLTILIHFLFGLDEILVEFRDLLFRIREIVEHLVLVGRLGLRDLLFECLTGRTDFDHLGLLLPAPPLRDHIGPGSLGSPSADDLQAPAINGGAHNDRLHQLIVGTVLDCVPSSTSMRLVVWAKTWVRSATSTVSKIVTAIRPTASTSSVVNPRCVRTLSMTT